MGKAPRLCHDPADAKTEVAMQVVVAGANGLTGRIVLRMLTEAGHQPVAMIRDIAQREELEALGAECRIGDLEKPVGYAVRGCRAAIFAAGSGSKTGPEKTIDVDQNGAMAFVETCVRMNARRFVMLSSIAADQPERGPESLHHYFGAKAVADRHLQASGLNYTIVRPGFLTNESGTGAIAAGDDLGPVAKETHSVTREDVARVLVDCLALDNTIEKTFEMIGGETPIADALKAL